MSAQITQKYKETRQHSIAICKSLEKEDYVVQPIADVSPPKWHLGHTTWFFETFILKQCLPNYKEFNSQYNFVFNSYYETVGARVIRTDRGNLSRPSVDDVYRYRSYVDEQMIYFLGLQKIDKQLESLLVLGLNHEQQHQELLLSDIKYILGHNPLFPVYENNLIINETPENENAIAVEIKEGIYEIGFTGDGFCFDNELNRHKVWLNRFKISKLLVSNREYLEFIVAGGYQQFQYWHAEGWDWVKKNNITAPLYWHFENNEWKYYNLKGLVPLDLNEALCHISFYEASAYSAWKNMRLPTEAEWEVASSQFNWGQRWEWTNSAYLPYPGFTKAAGAIGEYNGKFMVSQMVLRGASVATPANHSRNTYRNFFHPHARWQFMGIRLAE